MIFVCFVILDEVHKEKRGLLMLFVHFFAYLHENNDNRTQHVKFLLVTATRGGCSVEAIENRLKEAMIESRNMSIPQNPSHATFSVVDLWDENVAKKPAQWTSAGMPERACIAAASMAQCLWHKGSGAHILFFF